MSINLKTPAYLFLFTDNKLIVTGNQNNTQYQIPTLNELNLTDLDVISFIQVGNIQNKPCYTGLMPSGSQLNQMHTLGLRELFNLIDEEFFGIAIRAFHLVNWDRSSQYCGFCGTKTINHHHLQAKACPSCDNLIFPRISPAVIVAIIKDKQILLASSSRFQANFYSVLAGFVEPGETLEECVHREIKEEVGIHIKNITYFGSQPWPFPDSLMIAFTAEYDSGEVTIDGDEIQDAAWFTADNLPQIPGKMSISRKLIDWFIEKQ